MKKIALIAVLFAALMPSVAFSDAMGLRYLDVPAEYLPLSTNPRDVDGDTVVGYYESSLFQNHRSFFNSLSEGTWEMLNIAGASDTSLYSISKDWSAGSCTFGGKVHGLLYNRSSSTQRIVDDPRNYPNNPTGNNTVLYAIDDEIAAGVTNTNSNGSFLAVFTYNFANNGSQFTYITPPAGTIRVEPRGMSNGKMVGVLYNADGMNAFIYADGLWSFISAPGAANEHTTNLRGIANDIIVGDFVDSLFDGAIRHGFALNTTTGVYTIIDVVKDGVTVKSTIPYGVSTIEIDGVVYTDIVGTYDDPMGFHVQIPEPATMSLLAVGFLAILKRRRA